MKRTLPPIFLLVIPILLAFITTTILQATILTNQDQYIAWLSSFGPSFILIYILVQTLTIIIAPLGGFFIQIAIMALLSPLQAILLIYAVQTPVYFINFFLARRFGRPLVQRLIGKNGLDRVDQYAKNIGPSLLLITKLLQGGIFDYVSYAAGLTNIPFRTFALINILAGLPGVLFTYLVLAYVPNFTLSVLILLGSAYVFFGVALFVLHRGSRNSI